MLPSDTSEHYDVAPGGAGAAIRTLVPVSASSSSTIVPAAAFAAWIAMIFLRTPSTMNRIFHLVLILKYDIFVIINFIKNEFL
jgi:hypothetical protein